MTVDPQSATGPGTQDPGRRTVFFVAGEVSGDIQAAYLIEELLRRDPTLHIVGVGGRRMAAAGMTLQFDSSDWGVIGYVAPLLRVRRYLRVFRAVVAAIRDARPDLLVLVDFPGFNLRVADAIRTEIPILYYFPPMVSVRLGDRARRVAALGMRLLAVFPFEAAAYRAVGADVIFIGHPAVDAVRPRWDEATRRAHLGLTPGAPVVGLLPGSRAQEIAAHLPVMVAAAAVLRGTSPDLEFVLPVPANHLRPDVDRILARGRVPVVVTPEAYDAMAECTVLMAASGSVTLEAAVLGVPMVVVYRLNWLSWQILLRLTLTRHIALPNLLAGREIVPELVQRRFTVDHLVAQTGSLLGSPDRRAVMAADLRAATNRLGPPGAVGRAADELLAMLPPYDKMDTSRRVNGES